MSVLLLLVKIMRWGWITDSALLGLLYPSQGFCEWSQEQWCLKSYWWPKPKLKVSKTPVRVACWQHGTFSAKAQGCFSPGCWLCPIASTSRFHFQAVTRAEATISSISHLAYSKLEWVGFSLAYKWASGSSVSSRWDIIGDWRAWPWNKVQRISVRKLPQLR